MVRLNPALFKLAGDMMKAKGVHDFNCYISDLIRRDKEVHQLLADSQEDIFPAETTFAWK